MILNCVRPTQFSVIQTIHCNVGLKCFLFIYQNVSLLLSLYIRISFKRKKKGKRKGKEKGKEKGKGKAEYASERILKIGQ